jgi:ribose 5-phosphate isomerase A
MSHPVDAALSDARDRAARAAVGELRDGMIVGLGTGDTASRAIVALGERRLDVLAVATSERSAQLAKKVGLALRVPDEVERIDVTLDGADEIDPALRLIKGAGGALTRERLVARASRRLVIVADEGKLVSRLGETRRLPVEILPFGRRWTLARLAALGLDPIVREGFVTDNGGLLAECALGAGADASVLAATLWALPGVIDHGLFLDEAQLAYIGRKDGVERRAR